mmetsp:Transcript_1324/g.3729  ORF Transcript_1324/g.3729 Transcript_1324/m.3729 type:complete len:110 (+) Transcript_1324:239-568(+)
MRLCPDDALGLAEAQACVDAALGNADDDMGEVDDESSDSDIEDMEDSGDPNDEPARADGGSTDDDDDDSDASGGDVDLSSEFSSVSDPDSEGGKCQTAVCPTRTDSDAS